jgi:2-dehydropantoate 2-reductase
LQNRIVDTWPRVAVMGAGAVGCYFGGMLARADAPVTLIGRREHVEAIAREGLFFDSVNFQERVTVAASTQPDAVRDASLVLFCVKTLDTEEAARAIAPHLAPGAIVLSLQNGMDNVERIRAGGGFDALPAVVYVAAAMAGPGHLKHRARGDLVIGAFPSQQHRRDELQRASEVFERAGVPCPVSPNVEAELWTKLVYNCACNAPTTLARATYGRAARHPLASGVMRAVAVEALAVARAAGIRLPEAQLIEDGMKLAEKMGEVNSSTAQDIARGRRTEIDSLNGYVARRGRELGIPTPVNQTLYALVKLLEASSAPSSTA